MKTISILNLKGGVGKTFTTIQIAHHLKQSGYKVLLLDNDKQGNLSKFYKHFSNTTTCATATLLGAGRADLGELIKETEHKGLYIISANMSLLTATLKVSHTTAADQHLRYTRIKEQAEALGFDYMLIDNPPDMGLNVVNALVATDEVIVPLKVDEWALEGLDIVIDQIEGVKAFNPKIQLAGALVTHYKNNDANVAGVEWLKANKYKVFATTIRQSDKAAESIFFHSPVREYSPRSAAAIDYKKFMREYLEDSL